MLKHILSWKFLRICILLFILLLVWQNSQTQKALSTNWDTPLDVIYYPVNADGLSSTDSYILTLDEKDLGSVNSFLAKQGKTYSKTASTAKEWFRFVQYLVVT